MVEAVVEAVGERFRGPLGWWRARGVLVRDTLGAAAFAAVALSPVLAANGVMMGALPVRPAGSLAVVLALAQVLPLAGRRRWPAGCLAIVATAFAAYQCLGYPESFTSEGLILALYAAGAYEEHFRRGLAVVASAAYVALALVLAVLHSPERPVDYLTFYLVLACCSGAGALIRARQRAEAERRRHEAARAVAEERARIARELHDVVTHHVTAMVVQADAAQFQLPAEPGRVAGGLGEISATGRRALTELRYLLGLLDPAAPTAEPAFAAGRLRDLVEQTRRTGQPVELAEVGEPGPLAEVAQLAAYRVVQEALTNALKHAPGRRTVVRVQYGGEEISIDVTTDGSTAAANATAGTAANATNAGTDANANAAFTAGRGLTGLRERVSLCGGELLAGGNPGGGFSVRARVPAGLTRG